MMSFFNLFQLERIHRHLGNFSVANWVLITSSHTMFTFSEHT